MSQCACMSHSGLLQNLWVGHSVSHLQVRWQEAVQFVRSLVDGEFWSQNSNLHLPESQPLSSSAICSDGNVTIKSLCSPMSHKALCFGQVTHPHKEVHKFTPSSPWFLGVSSSQATTATGNNDNPIRKGFKQGWQSNCLESTAIIILRPVFYRVRAILRKSTSQCVWPRCHLYNHHNQYTKNPAIVPEVFFSFLSTQFLPYKYPPFQH